MTVSYENSKIIYDGIKSAGIRSMSALPETWLGLLLQRAEDDPGMQLVQVAREEEAVGIVTEGVLRALGIPFEHARDPQRVAKQIREAWTFSQSSLSPVALLLTRDLMED